jgi:hypothetical protein
LARSEVAGPADLVDAYQDRGTGDGPGRGPQPGMLSARRCPHGPGDGHDDAGHQQVPGPAHKHQRISPMPMLPSASSAVAPRLGPRQAAEHGALTHQRRVRADWAPSGCSISGEIGKHLLIDLADHAGSRRRVRGGARCDGGSLALAGRRILTNL